VAVPEARAHFERGDQLFKIGQFDDAIVEFKRAYELSPAPGLLFNIAQAYRAQKDREHALYFYTTYLREDPNAPEREYVEERIKELKQEPEPRADEPASTPAPPAPAVAPEIRADATEPSGGRGLRVAGAITAGGGVVLGVAAVFFGARAISASHEISSAFAQGETWNADRTALWERGRRDQTTAVVLGIAGGAALATGSILFVMGLRARHDSISVVAVPSAGGGQVALRCGF
jgi:tetratricopeptide (TPR) repeat protein